MTIFYLGVFVAKKIKRKFFVTSCLCGEGFTLVELVVAIAILAMIILFAGSIFKSSIGSYRMASAQAEVMQKLRVITGQLDSDFKGLRKDAPMFIWFQQDPNDPNQRFDQIMFFADGDFQATKVAVVGNLARIQYGQAQIYSPSWPGYVYPWQQQADSNPDRVLTKRKRTLARRQHIFAYNFANPPALPLFPIFSIGNNITIDANYNNTLEYDSSSLAQWQAAVQNGANTDRIITACFGDNAYNYNNWRPLINFADPCTLHLLMTDGVGSLSIQWSYDYNDVSTGLPHVLWWPSFDPDGNGNFLDSDFGAPYMGLYSFGFYFNAVAPPAPTSSYWFPYFVAKGYYYPDPLNPINPFTKPIYPKALKFTFTLYDSRGVFKNGQTFTHIVYLGD